MSKYICFCGETFKALHSAETHVKILTDLEIAEPYPRHKVFKQPWQARLSNWFFGLDIVYYLAFLSGAFINGFFLKYSQLTDWERIGESVCMGIVLSRLFAKDKK
jgi:hypothetical protein